MTPVGCAGSSSAEKVTKTKQKGQTNTAQPLDSIERRNTNFTTQPA